jgi:hypothetical protein
MPYYERSFAVAATLIQQKRLQWLPSPAKQLPARMNMKYIRDQQVCDCLYHSIMELYRHGVIQ